MNSKLLNAIMFAAGAAIGSVVTWKVLEKKYEKREQEAVDSVKEVFAKKKDSGIINGINIYNPDNPYVDPLTENIEDPLPISKKPSLAHYANMLRSEGYMIEPDEPEDEDDGDEPILISGEEFGQKEGYELESLYYWADGVVTDLMEEPIDDPEGLLGRDFAKALMESEDTSVYVRNHDMETDYEVLLRLGKFSDRGENE